MWEQDWALLGIEPTSDLVAIKKAYALKLKTTRPDDDAEAYQALRGAYERVQQWLKWQLQELNNDLGGEPASQPSPDLVPGPEPKPTYAPQLDELLHERSVQSGELTSMLEQHWRAGDEPALMAAWREVRLRLDQLPLSRQVELSIAFARWALSLPDLPDDLLKQLDEYFGWLDDFRTARRVGLDLAQRLNEGFSARLRPRAIDPALIALAAPLQGLNTLRKTGAAAWRLLLLSFLLQPTLAHAMTLLGSQLQRQLGLDVEAQRWLSEATLRGNWLRTGFAAVISLAASQAVFGNAFVAIGHALTWLISAGLLAWCGALVGALLCAGATVAARWRRPIQPMLALGWLLFAAWLASQETNPPAIAWEHVPPNEIVTAWVCKAGAWFFGLSGLLMAWPLVPLYGYVVAGLSPLVGYLAAATLGNWLQLPSCLLIAATWMLTATSLAEGRLRLRPWAEVAVRWLTRPMLNTLAIADRWNYTVAVLPAALSGAWAVLSDGHVAALHLFMAWLLSIIVISWLQAKADAWSLRQLPPPAGPDRS